MWDCFEEIRCINLPHRTDRWQMAQDEFRIAGLGDRVKRCDGVLNRADPAIGCRTAHINVVRQARASGLRNVLIFEDDIIFNRQAGDLLASIFEQLRIHSDWDLCYLGSYPGYRAGVPVHGEIIGKVSANILEVKRFWGGHAYAIRSSLYDSILRKEIKYKQIDKLLATDISMECRTYHVYPPLFSQTSGFSDIQGRVVLNQVDTGAFLGEWLGSHD